MFQIKDNVLVAKMMIFPSFIIIACLIIYRENPEKVMIKQIESLFTMINYILPIIIILSLIYIYFVIKNYKDGIIITQDTHRIEYPTLLSRKQANIFNFDNSFLEKDGMYYKANFTGSSSPIIFKVSSTLVFNDIASKIRTVKNL
ncbi:hypothetical protein ACOL28_00520 [Aliarcobacter butzleri]